MIQCSKQLHILHQNDLFINTHLLTHCSMCVMGQTGKEVNLDIVFGLSKAKFTQFYTHLLMHC
jgi:hypothetical protein